MKTASLLIAIALCFAMAPARADSPPTLTVPNTSNVPPGGSPIEIESCTPRTTGGLLVSQSDGNFNVVFTNEGAVAADLVRFQIDYGSERLFIRDVGHFSPGVTVTHVFRRRGGNVVSSPLFGGTSFSCTVAAAHFVNGSEWTPPASDAAIGEPIALPGGTGVDVSVAEAVSSASANKDDTIPIVVDKEIDADGWVLIPKGAHGQATISDVERAGGNGHGGKIALTIDWVYSADGGKVVLSSVNHTQGGGDQKGASSTATIATYVLLGPLGLFAHNFVRGRDVTIDTKQVLHVFVDHTVHVRASEHPVAPSGFDN
ncbi:MAG: hypothetical protein ACREM8_02965 [Vulcanimicrobiaceae bacterium]